jgi:hypothetical protein
MQLRCLDIAGLARVRNYLPALDLVTSFTSSSLACAYTVE